MSDVPKAAIEAARKKVRDVPASNPSYISCLPETVGYVLGSKLIDAIVDAALTAAAPFMQEELRRDNQTLRTIISMYERRTQPFADGIEAAAQLADRDYYILRREELIAAIRALKPQPAPAQPPSLTYVDPTAGLNPDFNWDGNG